MRNKKTISQIQNSIIETCDRTQRLIRGVQELQKNNWNYKKCNLDGIYAYNKCIVPLILEIKKGNKK